MEKVKSFEDLLCWQKAREIRKDFSMLIRALPEFEKYELVSQMRRASRSITHNIAEGYGRYHYKENSQFCRISRGSLYELLDQLITAQDEDYIDKELYNRMRLKIIECITVLNGYINYLNKAAQ